MELGSGSTQQKNDMPQINYNSQPVGQSTQTSLPPQLITEHTQTDELNVTLPVKETNKNDRPNNTVRTSKSSLDALMSEKNKTPSFITKKPSYRTLDITISIPKNIEPISKQQSYRSLMVPSNAHVDHQEKLVVVPEEKQYLKKDKSYCSLDVQPLEGQKNTVETQKKDTNGCHCAKINTPDPAAVTNPKSFSSSNDNLLSTEHLQEITKLNQRLSQESRKSNKSKIGESGKHKKKKNVITLHGLVLTSTESNLSTATKSKKKISNSDKHNEENKTKESPKNVIKNSSNSLHKFNNNGTYSVETLHKDTHLNPMSTDRVTDLNHIRPDNVDHNDINDLSPRKAQLENADGIVFTTNEPSSNFDNKASFKVILPKRELLPSQDMAQMAVVNENKTNTSNFETYAIPKHHIASSGNEELPKSQNLSDIPEPMDILQTYSNEVAEYSSKKKAEVAIPNRILDSTDKPLSQLSANIPMAPQASEETPNRSLEVAPPRRLPNSAEERKKNQNSLRSTKQNLLVQPSSIKGNRIRFEKSIQVNHFTFIEPIDRSNISSKERINSKYQSKYNSNDSNDALHHNVDHIRAKSDIVEVRQRPNRLPSSAHGPWGTSMEEGLSPDFWILEPTHKVEFFIGVFVVSVMLVPAPQRSVRVS